ncbi:MAG: ABC transporter ATP-binding protein [Methylobacteriaceae bacterium]|nr:ABC transporter ATP-binding protein [Methylobacteriaceae bacterium]
MRLAFEKVGVGYDGRRVVAGVDLTIDDGEVVALIGPNGSGKSSLVRAAAGLLAHDGAIRFGAGPRAAARIGYMPQDEGRRPALTALEVVLLGRMRGLGFRVADADLDAAEAMMAELAIAGFAERLVGELSGGQRQLVYLAQALVAEPDALLLDEPTSALDMRHQLDVLASVRRLTRSRGLACLLVLHDLNAAARFSDRIAVLHEGRLACCAPPEEALTAARIAEVFGVEAAIGRAPDGRPTVTPLAAIG